MNLQAMTTEEFLLKRIKDLLQKLFEKLSTSTSGGNQFALRDRILNGELFTIDELSQRIVKEELVIQTGGELIVEGRLYIEI